MKKLIAISVVFALIAGVVFAADLGVDVFGHVNLIEGTTMKDDDDVRGTAAMDRIRLSGAGQNDDGTFGAWYRLDGHSDATFNAFAWWKPIDQLKLTIGGNPDGMYGKEGITGWGFNGIGNDAGINFGGHKVYGVGWSPYNSTGAQYRDAFYGGFGGQGLMLDIYPVDIATITIILPYFRNAGLPAPDDSLQIGQVPDSGVAGVFKNVIAQVDVQLEGTGSFALTFENSFQAKAQVGKDTMDSTIYGYFNLTAIDNMSLDLGVSLRFGDSDYQPIAAGVGLKYDISDEFGIKFRAMGRFGGMDKAPTFIFADVNPYYAISDDVKASFDVGLTMIMPDSGDSAIGFHINPSLQIGGEYGPAFLVGFKLNCDGWNYKDGANVGFASGDKVITWEVPIALVVGF